MGKPGTHCPPSDKFKLSHHKDGTWGCQGLGNNAGYLDLACRVAMETERMLNEEKIKDNIKELLKLSQDELFELLGKEVSKEYSSTKYKIIKGDEQ